MKFLIFNEFLNCKFTKILNFETGYKMSNRVLVTGGTGLVGKAIEIVLKEQNRGDERWIFIGSKDADLMLVKDD